MDKMVVYHNNNSVKTIQDLIEEKHIITTKEFTYKDFFDENRTRIFQQLSDEYRCELAEKKYGKDATIDDLSEGDLEYDMVLPCPCTLELEVQYATSTLEITETNFQENVENFFVFEDSQISKIMKNKEYVINQNTKKQIPDVKVFGWFKSYYEVSKELVNNRTDVVSLNYKRFVEISNHIIDISTNVSKNGGTFKITLPLIPCIGNRKTLNGTKLNSEWASSWYGFKEDYQNKIINSKVYIHDLNNRIDSVLFNKSFFSKNSLKNTDLDLFGWLIQSNDLIFINFGDDIKEMEDDIGMRCFDMIGLVDEVSISRNANGSGSVVVSGRDLMKLIQEDSSLFFNKSTAWGGSQIFGNTESYMKTGDILSSDMLGGKITPVDRLRRLTNEINIFAYPNKSIDFILKGVIQKLVNIEICPDDIFSFWGNRRTKFNQFQYEKETVEEDNTNEIDLNTDEEMQVDEELNVNINANSDKTGNETWNILNKKKAPNTKKTPQEISKELGIQLPGMNWK